MSRSRSLRREAPILLPASLLLFALLGAVTLWSYRSAVAALTAERERSTLELATRLAEMLRQAGSDDLTPVARWLPRGAALALYDESGRLRTSVGFADALTLDLPLEARQAPSVPRIDLFPSTMTEVRGAEPVVRALVPFRRENGRYLLRLETPEPELFAQGRSLRILTPVVLVVAAAVALLAIFFFRALVRPYEELLVRVRAAVPPERLPDGAEKQAGEEADVEELLAAFDRALATLRERSDERAAIEETLGPHLEGGLLLFDREGHLVAANPAAVALLGGDATAGEPSLEAFRAALAQQPELARQWQGAMSEGRSVPRSATTVAIESRKVEIGWSLQMLRRSGSAGGYLLLLADTTDLSRRESEARFAAGLAQLGELSAGVAHELRNSLATLQGYLDLASRRDLPQAAREELGEARHEATALSRIVDDFLTFARPKTGSVEPVDLVALARRAASDPALSGEIVVEFAPPEGLAVAVPGDADLLHRALRNVLLNAVQASAAKAVQSGGLSGPVRLNLEAETEEVAIVVDDAGTGLAPAIRQRLFEPFVSGRPGGAGLGLALARRIVLMHGGTLALQESARGGVRVEIRLPSGEDATKRNPA